MKRSLSHGSGFLEIDHTNSPGLTPADVAQMPGAIPVPGGERFEADVQQCSHCQRGVVLNPGRVRARGYCQSCDHYLCDDCEVIRSATGECVPFKAKIDEANRIAQKFTGQPDHPEATPGIVLTDDWRRNPSA